MYFEIFHDIRTPGVFLQVRNKTFRNVADYIIIHIYIIGGFIII